MSIILVAVMLVPVALGFAFGYLILREGGGFHSGSSSRARAVIGLLILGCVGMTLYNMYAAVHFPVRAAGDMALPGLSEYLFAWVCGLVGGGLVLAFLISLRSPPRP
jgi:hypothetical protein